VGRQQWNLIPDIFPPLFFPFSEFSPPLVPLSQSDPRRPGIAQPLSRLIRKDNRLTSVAVLLSTRNLLKGLLASL